MGLSSKRLAGLALSLSLAATLAPSLAGAQSGAPAPPNLPAAKGLADLN